MNLERREAGARRRYQKFLITSRPSIYCLEAIFFVYPDGGVRGVDDKDSISSVMDGVAVESLKILISCVAWYEL